MERVTSWQRNQETQAFFVALDIAGFSRFMDDADQLLAHRSAFFEAVAHTSLFARAQQTGQMQVHFLGDELRLAFLRTLDARAVRDFILDVQARLTQLNTQVHVAYHTRVKGTVLAGVVTWREWRGCDYLDGALPFKAQRWMEQLRASEIAIDLAFKNAITSAGILTGDLPTRDFAGESGYLLCMEDR